MARSKLKRKRISLNLTQQEVADLIGITRSYYTEIENGKRGCKIQIWLKIAKVFDIPDSELIPYITEGIKK